MNTNTLLPPLPAFQPSLVPLPSKLIPAPALTPEEEKEQEELARRAAKLPPIENSKDLIAENMIEPPELIEGLLHQGSKMSIGGASKSSKTWMMLDLALSVVNGMPWLGCNTKKARVLYCNFELPRVFTRKRIIAIKEARGMTEDFDIWNLRGEAASCELIVPLILERIRSESYGLLIIDPLYKLLGDRDENSASDMAQVMNTLEKLTVKANAALVFADHFSKGNQSSKDHMDRVSGSGVKHRDPDSIITLTSHIEKDAYVVETKLRNLKPMDPFCVAWKYPVMLRNEKLNPAKLKTAVTKDRQYTEDQLLAQIAAKGMTCSEWLAAVIRETGMSRATFNRLLETVRETPGVAYDAKTKRYSYTNPNGATLSQKLVSPLKG